MYGDGMYNYQQNQSNDVVYAEVASLKFSSKIITISPYNVLELQIKWSVNLANRFRTNNQNCFAHYKSDKSFVFGGLSDANHGYSNSNPQLYLYNISLQKSSYY